MVATPLKNISQNGNLPQIGVNIEIFETTTQKILFFMTVIIPKSELRVFWTGLRHLTTIWGDLG